MLGEPSVRPVGADGTVTTYGRVWGVVAAPMIAVGLFESVLAVPPMAAVTGAVTVGAMAALQYLSRFTGRTSRCSRRVLAVRVGAGMLVGAAVSGLVALLGATVLVLVVAVACCHPAVLVGVTRRIRRLLQPGGNAPTETGVTLGTHPEPVAARAASPARTSHRTSKVIPTTTPPEQAWPAEEELRLLDVAQLCWGWRVSFTALARTEPWTCRERWVMLVGVRRRYLDEIARRDPAGVARWLYHGARPASDPSRYLRTGGDVRRSG